MIVEYDKEIDMVYVSKKIENRWVQVGFTRDEVEQIYHAGE
jgi:ubiquitin